ncbi:nutrient deprivation-induced protein [Neorhizobium lilium]|uniref:Nutrient deprivation-induced protein n=1 Tax=Neorhizobium lilium TaxID=2503024 RepID=A0A444LKN1_9HYPH|nr:nutrient deprivation-induced protein [Neorhizobium lilium]RWX80848.1 nutrient deprivation-induced protein [Neorhizobium lilium]
MTERDSGQGGVGTTSSSYASFKDQAASYGDGQATQASPSSQSPAVDIKQKVSEDLRSVQQKAQDGIADVTDKAKDTASKQKNMVAEKVSGIAAAMEKIGSELEQGDQADIGRMTKNLSTSIRKFSEDIKDRDLGQIAEMAEDFGRKQPLAFLGIAAVAGIAATRFLTASASRHGSSNAPVSPQAGAFGAATSSSAYPSSGSVTTEDKTHG